MNLSKVMQFNALEFLIVNPNYDDNTILIYGVIMAGH